VIVSAPAAFRWTYDAMPERHHHVAALLAGAARTGAGPDDLPAVLADLMRDVGAPASIGALGYDASDVPALVEGALKQQRLLAVAPKPPGPADLEAIVRASL
jgi:alcohol dehydrogenase class IV